MSDGVAIALISSITAIVTTALNQLANRRNWNKQNDKLVEIHRDVQATNRVVLSRVNDVEIPIRPSRTWVDRPLEDRE